VLTHDAPFEDHASKRMTTGCEDLSLAHLGQLGNKDVLVECRKAANSVNNARNKDSRTFLACKSGIDG